MKKIIVVESEKTTLDFYEMAFKNAGYDVEVASGMGQMLEELRQIRIGQSAKPDLILTDFVLDDGRGLEILKAVKKNLFTSDIPVFAFTNYENPDIHKEMEKNRITPEKYLIKADHTPAQLAKVVKCYFAGPAEGPNTILS